MFRCDGCEQSDLVSAGVQPVFSHGEEGLESGGESLSGQVKAHSLFCVIHPWGLNVESVTGASLAFIFHKSHLKHANCEQNQLPNQIILPRQKRKNIGKCCIEQISWLKMCMVQIRNIAAKQIQFNKINKSNCTSSFQHGIHLSQVSTKTCKFVKCCIEQIRRLKMSMIEIRNIASKQIQLKKSNKSYCTASLQKGYEIGGRGSEGSSEKFCEEFFFPVGLILLSTHRGFQIYPILAA